MFEGAGEGLRSVVAASTAPGMSASERARDEGVAATLADEPDTCVSEQIMSILKSFHVLYRLKE